MPTFYAVFGKAAERSSSAHHPPPGYRLTTSSEWSTKQLYETYCSITGFNTDYWATKKRVFRSLSNCNSNVNQTWLIIPFYIKKKKWIDHSSFTLKKDYVCVLICCLKQFWMYINYYKTETVDPFLLDSIFYHIMSTQYLLGGQDTSTKILPSQYL